MWIYMTGEAFVQLDLDDGRVDGDNIELLEEEELEEDDLLNYSEDEYEE